MNHAELIAQLLVRLTVTDPADQALLTQGLAALTRAALERLAHYVEELRLQEEADAQFVAEGPQTPDPDAQRIQELETQLTECKTRIRILEASLTGR